MKVTATTEQEVEISSIQVSAHVRYWDDWRINGADDIDGQLIPFRKGENWEPLIDLETGRIANWPTGTEADIHYKVCDAGIYKLLDRHGKEVAVLNGYVPDLLCPEGGGYGDYIIMKISADGVIAKWSPAIEPEDWEWRTA